MNDLCHLMRWPFSQKYLYCFSEKNVICVIMIREMIRIKGYTMIYEVERKGICLREYRLRIRFLR